MELNQIIDCATGEIINVNSATGEVVEVIQEATINGEKNEISSNIESTDD